MIIELQEYTTKSFPEKTFTKEMGKILWQNYRDKIDIVFPSPATVGMWQLTSKGWVGYIPITSDFGIRLSPRVNLSNLFRMLEYAYRLESFKFIDGLIDCATLNDFYERLANILCLKIMDRSRRGFYRSYDPFHEVLPYVRGRLDMHRAMAKPWAVNLKCHYEEHTADIEDNQILAWTLHCIARTGMCSDRVMPIVRKAYRTLLGCTNITPCAPRTCIKRLYNRLNNDYEPMHVLCRFFLENSGPTHKSGDKTFIPFIVNMPRLFELFVAEWLKKHLPHHFTLKYQERVNFESDISFDIDIVIYDTVSGDTLCVIDTKYKNSASPNNNDIYQVVSYAEAKNCRDAVLVYPIRLSNPADLIVGKKRVRTFWFEIDKDINESGEKLTNMLLQLDKNN